MPIVFSRSNLRDRIREITSLCRDQDEPVFITKKGEHDPVLMRLDSYERLNAQLSLTENLFVAQAQSAAGKLGLSHREMMAKLRRRGKTRRARS